MDKQKYFRKPTNVIEIIGDKEANYASRFDLIGQIESIVDEEAIIINYPIIPRNHRNGFEDWQNFLKRGTEVYLKTPETRQEALEERIMPNVLLKQAFESLDERKNYCGYVWTGYRSERRKKVHLTDCIEGAKLFSFSENSRRLEDKIERRDYTNGNKDHGGTFTFKVPSRTNNVKYLLRLESVPLIGTKNQYAVWADMNSLHACELKTNEFSFRRASKEDVFCPHEIAAYLTLARKEYEKTSRVMLMPFFIPKEETVKFWSILRNNVMVEEQKQRGNKIRNVKRPLNKAEIETLLWKFIAKHRGDVAFQARRKLKEYEW